MISIYRLYQYDLMLIQTYIQSYVSTIKVWSKLIKFTPFAFTFKPLTTSLRHMWCLHTNINWDSCNGLTWSHQHKWCVFIMYFRTLMPKYVFSICSQGLTCTSTSWCNRSLVRSASSGMMRRLCRRPNLSTSGMQNANDDGKSFS